MKTFIVRISFIGLAGPYTSDVTIKARNAKSAERKAYSYIGDRTYTDIQVISESAKAEGR